MVILGFTKAKIQLDWQTATERNNAGFDIQLSTDPLSSGMYMLKFYTHTSYFIKKVVKR